MPASFYSVQSLFENHAFSGTFKVEAKGPGGEATFYYQKTPCGGMLNPFQLQMHDLAATSTAITTPSNESKF